MTTITSPLHYNNPAGALAADLRMAAIIQAQVNMVLADNQSLRKWVHFAGDVQGTGSDTLRLRYANIGSATPYVAVGETVALTGSAADGTVSSIAVARSGLMYEISDKLTLTGLGQDLDPFLIAERMVFAAEARMSQIIAATFDSITASVGTSGVDMGVSDFLNALYTLELASNPAPYTCILHNRQVADLQAALRTENNNFLSFSEQTERMSEAKPNGYIGRLLNVDIVRSDYVDDDAGANNYVGAMFSPMGIGYAIGSIPALAGSAAEVRPGGSPVAISLSRNDAQALTEVTGHLYAGASILEDSRCVKIVTDK